MKESANWKAWRTSSDIRHGDIWDIHTITETHHVESKVIGKNVSIPTDVPSILNETGTGAPVVKDIGDPWGSGTGWLDGFLLRDMQWTKNGRGADVKQTYSSRYFYTNAARGIATTCTDGACENLANATTLSAGLFLPCEMLPTFRTRSTRLLHDGYTTNPPPALDESAHIGGFLKEREMQVKQVAIRLRMVIDAESLSIDGVVDAVLAYKGKLNLRTFMGFDAGSVVCDGPTLNHLEHEFFELVMDYTADDWFHHSQIATKGSDNRPTMSGTNYAEVKWKREARASVDFNDIFPAGDLGKSQKYQALAGKWW